MVRACKFAGAVLRPNSSLAGVAGSSGLASGGNGCGLSVPLSCAVAVVDTRTCANSSAPAHPATAHRAMAHRAMAHRAILRRAARGAFILVMRASDREFRRPRGAVPARVGLGLRGAGYRA